MAQVCGIFPQQQQSLVPLIARQLHLSSTQACLLMARSQRLQACLTAHSIRVAKNKEPIDHVFSKEMEFLRLDASGCTGTALSC